MRSSGPAIDTESTEFEGIEFLELGSTVRTPPRRSVLNFLSFGVSLIGHLRTHNYDIVDAQAFSPLLFGYLGTLLTRSRLVATIHDASDSNSSDFFQFKRLGSMMESALYRIGYEHIVTVSEATRNVLISRYGHSPGKVHVAYNGVCLGVIDNIQNRATVRDLIYVGRLAPHKHVEDFIEVCRRTRRSGAIVGHGPLKKEIQKAAASCDQVEFIGALPDYGDVLIEMKRSGVLVLPSTREGFGIVLAEAGACGLPVVAYVTGGVCEVVENNITGYLVAPRDVDSLCNAVESALSPKERESLGSAGKNLVRAKFNADINNAKVEKIYLKAIGLKSQG